MPVELHFYEDEKFHQLLSSQTFDLQIPQPIAILQPVISTALIKPR